MERKKQQETIRSLAEDPVLAQRYELMEVVGEGCFGKIIKARNKRDNSICAIKLENLRKAKFKPMLRNEI
jgi:serine/threonine protein kinase